MPDYFCVLDIKMDLLPPDCINTRQTTSFLLPDSNTLPTTSLLLLDSNTRPASSLIRNPSLLAPSVGNTVLSSPQNICELKSSNDPTKSSHRSPRASISKSPSASPGRGLSVVHSESRTNTEIIQLPSILLANVVPSKTYRTGILKSPQPNTLQIKPETTLSRLSLTAPPTPHGLSFVNKSPHTLSVPSTAAPDQSPDFGAEISLARLSFARSPHSLAGITQLAGYHSL